MTTDGFCNCGSYIRFDCSSLDDLLRSFSDRLTDLEKNRCRHTDPDDKQLDAPVSVTTEEEEERGARVKEQTSNNSAEALTAMKLMQDQMTSLKEENAQLRQEIQDIKDTVRSLEQTSNNQLEPADQGQFVTLDVLQSTLLIERESIKEEIINLGITNEATETDSTCTSPNTASGGSELDPETLKALKSVSKLTLRIGKMEGAFAALKEEKVDRSQLEHIGERLTRLSEELTHLSELTAGKASLDVLNQVATEQKQLRALMDSLMDERRERYSTSEETPEHVDSSRYQELEQQLTSIWESVQRLEEDVKTLKSLKTSQYDSDSDVQDQVNHIQTRVILTSQQSSANRDDGYSTHSSMSTNMDDGHSAHSSMSTRSLSSSRELEYLQNAVCKLQQQTRSSTEAMMRLENMSNAITKLETDHKQLYEAIECLIEDNRKTISSLEEQHKRIDELHKQIDKVKDAFLHGGKQENCTLAFDNQRSCHRFERVVEQLYALFDGLMDRVVEQEQDWHKAFARLTSNIENMPDRTELDSVKKQIKIQLKNIYVDDDHSEIAAASRIKIIHSLHCLSCGKPVTTTAPPPEKPHLHPAFPAQKQSRPAKTCDPRGLPISSGSTNGTAESQKVFLRLDGRVYASGTSATNLQPPKTNDSPVKGPAASQK